MNNETKKEQIKRLQRELAEEEQNKFTNLLTTLKSNYFIESLGLMQNNVILLDSSNYNLPTGDKIYAYIKDIDFGKYSNSNDLILYIKCDYVKVFKRCAENCISYKQDRVLTINLNYDSYDKIFKQKYLKILHANQGNLNKHFHNLKNGFENIFNKYANIDNNDFDAIDFAAKLDKKFNELIKNEKN